jgi:hypothetical protein
MNEMINIIVIVAIIIAIGVVVYLLYNKYANTSGMHIMKKMDEKEAFINAINTMLDKNFKTIVQHIVIKDNDIEILRNIVYNKCLALYPANVDKMGTVCVDELMGGLKSMKYNIDAEVENDLRRDSHYAIMYTNYLKDRWKLPGEYVEPTSLSLKRLGQSRLPANELNIGNMINDEINKEHVGIIPKKNYFMGINANNLTAGIERSGFSNTSVGSRTTDIRGRPPALIRRISALSSSKDPNSMARYAGGSVGDVLLNSRGLCNETTHDNAVDAYFTRTRDPAYSSMKSITNRLQVPAITKERLANENIMGNIKEMIMNGM